MRSILFSVSAGLALVLAFPPYGLGFVVPIAVFGFLWGITEATRAGEAWLAGAGFGLAFFGLLFPWIAELGVVALIPLLVTQAVFPMVFARVLHHLGTAPEWLWWLGATGGWAIMELARLRVPFGGFGWGLAGYPMGEYSLSRDATQFFGTTGWSVLLVGLSAGAVVAIRSSRSTFLIGPAAVIATMLALGAVFTPSSDGSPVRVAIVQGSTPCPQQRCSGERALIYRSHLDLTGTIAAGSVDLVVWPEGSSGLDVDPVDNPEVAAEVAAQAVRIGAPILIGSDRGVSDTEWINANVVFDPDGSVVGEYRKRHPVPFGEYVPLRPLFDWIPALSRVPRDMIRGSGPVIFDTGFGPFGSVISFESSFSRYTRDTVNEGAQLVVVATSQASYPFSDASDQLIGMTRMRSAELGVDLVHAAVTGRSTFITDGGVVGPRTDLIEASVLTGTVHMSAGSRTVFAVFGDWLAATMSLALVIALVWSGRDPVAHR